MYSEKIKQILEDIENKEIDVAGGSAVGIILSTVNSLIKYIANLTVGKKKYEDVQEKIKEIIDESEKLKKQALDSIDKDVLVLENLLNTYKKRNENKKEYQEACIQATEFSLEVIKIAYKTLELSNEISKVGNKMLASDFNICKYFSKASIEAAKENYFINFNSIENEETKQSVNEKYLEILNRYEV